MALDEGIPPGVRGVLFRLEALTGQKTVTLRDVVEAFGEAAFVPLLIVPALVVVSPLSGIPFLPTVFGSVIALVALQALVGKRRLWLPGVLMRRRISGERLESALRRVHRLAEWIDRNSRSRLTPLTRPPLDAGSKALCVVSGASMPFLELVPFSSTLLGVAVVLLSTSLLVRDGVFVLLGAAVMGLAALIPLAIYGGLILA